jgi:hypothetical protein
VQTRTKEEMAKKRKKVPINKPQDLQDQIKQTIEKVLSILTDPNKVMTKKSKNKLEWADLNPIKFFRMKKL